MKIHWLEKTFYINYTGTGIPPFRLKKGYVIECYLDLSNGTIIFSFDNCIEEGKRVYFQAFNDIEFDDNTIICPMISVVDHQYYFKGVYDKTIKRGYQPIWGYLHDWIINHADETKNDETINNIYSLVSIEGLEDKV